MPSFHRLLLAVAVIVLTQLPSRAGFIYVETSRGGTDGELSSNNLAPTVLAPMTVGVNSVTGQVTSVGGGANLTADIFTFQVPANHVLQTIVLSGFNTSAGSVAMFIGLDNGPTFEFTVGEMNDNVNFPNVALLMAATTVGNTHVGTDILDDLKFAGDTGNGSPFNIPLVPGAYTVYIQETGAFSNYSLNFNVVAVPEPSSMLLVTAIAAGAGSLAKYRKRKRSQDGSTG